MKKASRKIFEVPIFVTAIMAVNMLKVNMLSKTDRLLKVNFERLKCVNIPPPASPSIAMDTDKNT